MNFMTWELFSTNSFAPLGKKKWLSCSWAHLKHGFYWFVRIVLLSLLEQAWKFLLAIPNQTNDHLQHFFERRTGSFSTETTIKWWVPFVRSQNKCSFSAIRAIPVSSFLSSIKLLVGIFYPDIYKNLFPLYFHNFFCSSNILHPFFQVELHMSCRVSLSLTHHFSKSICTIPAPQLASNNLLLFPLIAPKIDVEFFKKHSGLDQKNKLPSALIGYITHALLVSFCRMALIRVRQPIQLLCVLFICHFF